MFNKGSKSIFMKFDCLLNFIYKIVPLFFVFAITFVVYNYTPQEKDINTVYVTVITLLLGWNILSVIKANNIIAEIEKRKQEIIEEYQETNKCLYKTIEEVYGAMCCVYEEKMKHFPTDRDSYMYLSFCILSILNSSKINDIESCKQICNKLLKYENKLANISIPVKEKSMIDRNLALILYDDKIDGLKDVRKLIASLKVNKR